jgi:hypothetical protein
MAQLILYDFSSNTELGRRAMAEDERYHFYDACGQVELLTFNGLRYRVKEVKWRMPERECVVRVTFDSKESSASIDCD